MPIIESIQRIHEEEQKMKEYAKFINDSERGTVRIAYLGDRIERWFWELFQTFGEKYPKIRCEIRKKTHSEVEKDLEDGLLDFAFSFSTNAKNYEYKQAPAQMRRQPHKGIRCDGETGTPASVL